jgi:hypothetical protein
MINTRTLRIWMAVGCLLFALAAAGNGPAAEIDIDEIEQFFGKDWYGLYMFGQKIGYAMTELGPTEYRGDRAYNLSVQMHFEFTMLGMKQSFDMQEARTYGPDGTLRSLKVDVPQPAGMLTQFVGEVVDENFRLSVNSGGQEQVILIEPPNETLRDELAAAAMINEKTAVGDSWEMSIYEPTLDPRQTLRAKSVVTAVEETVYNGVPTRVFRVDTTIVGKNLVSKAKVTERGEVLEDQVGNGAFTMRLEDETLAKDVQYVADVVVSAAISTARPISRPRQVARMTVRIEGISDEKLVVADERQSYTLTVSEPREEASSSETTESASATSYVLAVTKDDLEALPPTTIPMRPEEFGSALRPGLFVQSGDEKIVNLAKTIVGEESDAVKAMRALNRYVYRNIRKDFTASISNALDTLERGSGDCTEHSVLFVALARAVGLPAREVAGLVYSAEGGNAFFFHQWAEVYVGKWIATDPTFGQPVADATHIKLTEGDILSQARIMNVMGRLRIEIIDTEYQ